MSQRPLTAAALACLAALAACGDDDAPARDTVETPETADATDVADATDAADVDTEEPPMRVTIVSLNLRCLIDDWDARLPILVDGLAAIDPDVLGLQEVCAETGVRDALPELVAGLEARTGRTYALHRAVTHRAWDTYDEGIAIASALPLSDPHMVPLPTGVFTRRLVLARLTLPDGGTLAFGTTHLDHQSGDTRKRQAEAAVTALAAYAGADEPRVVTGDLNEGPTGGMHAAFVAGGLVDTWAALHPGDAGPTFPAANPVDRIDYIWLDARTTGLAAVAITRILSERVGGVLASDHLGLAATLEGAPPSR